jgi:predicted acetylornithine/succinylornithine family transaminase
MPRIVYWETCKMNQSALMNTYKRAEVTFTRGEGEFLFDSKGKRYIDLLSGIAVVAVGHGNPRVAEAISEQARSLVHVSNLFGTVPMRELADRIRATTGGWGRAFFCNSGAEANECAIKLARKAGTGGRFRVLAAEGGFHGRTLASLACTGQPEKWKGFEPLPEGFVHRPYNNLDAFASTLDDSFAAIMVEPIQGERGVIPGTAEFLKGLRDLCDRAGIPLIFDEVQTGVGRTGEWWAFQSVGVKPDIFTSAKGIANGLPLGACIADEPYGSVFVPGDHGTTYGGGPVVCAAALAVFDEIERLSLRAEAKRKGELLTSLLRNVPGVQEVRGAGLMRGVVLERPIALQVVPKALSAGVVVNATSDSVLRLVPPLVISDHSLKEAVEIIAGILAETRSGEMVSSDTSVAAY